MNTPQPLRIFFAPVGQDKLRSSTLSPASSQPVTATLQARNTQDAPNPQKREHSTKRRTVLAAGWIDGDTDAVIQQRKRQTGWTRSKVVATMLKESGQRDAFARNQAILVPIIQEAMRTEFRAFERGFENR